MSKGLEALRKIDYEARYVNRDDDYNLIKPYKATNVCEEEFNIIEKELKALEIIKKHITEEFGINNDKYQRHAFLLRFMEGEEKDYEFIKEVLWNE